ncbi:MAG: hypothetical protein WCP16_23645 [Pseudanabaena sp. ELA645]
MIPTRSEALTCKQLGSLAANSPDCQNSSKNRPSVQSSTSMPNGRIIELERAIMRKVPSGPQDEYMVWYVLDNVTRQSNTVTYFHGEYLQNSNGKLVSDVLGKASGNCRTKVITYLAIYDRLTGKEINRPEKGQTNNFSDPIILNKTPQGKALVYACKKN